MSTPRRFVLLAICLLPPLIAGCKQEQAAARAQQPADPVEVTLASSRIGPVQREVEVVGTLYGDEETTVSAKVPGRIVQIARDVGDRAAAGAVLAQIDKTDYELAVAQKRMAVQAALAKLGLSELPPPEFDLSKVPTVVRARLQAANAQAKFERGRKLHEQKPPLMSDQDFADLQTAYEVAQSNHDVELLTARSLVADARALQSELDLEMQKLADTTIRAPQPGIDAKAQAREGAKTQATAGAHPMQATADAPPTQAPPMPATVGAPPMQASPTQAPATRDAASPRGMSEAGKPISYALATRQTSVGEYVREGTPLFRLVADDPVKFRPQVAERFLGQVKVGQAVRVRVEAYPDIFQGTVTRISPAVELASRSFQVEIVIPNAAGKLQPGSFARGAILTRVDPQVTLVPRDAIVTFAGVSKVFTINAERKAVEKKIELGQTVGDAVEVVSGLQGAVPLVTEGRNRLATGTPVVAAPTTAPAKTQPAAAERVP